MKLNPEKTNFNKKTLEMSAKKFEAWWKRMNFDGDWKKYHKGKKGSD